MNPDQPVKPGDDELFVPANEKTPKAAVAPTVPEAELENPAEDPAFIATPPAVEK